jgi:hypothetical protein
MRFTQSAASVTEHFSLGMLARVMQGWTLSEAPFDPAGGWENQYTFYTLIHNNRRNPVYGIPAGSLRLKRTATRNGRFRLEFDYRKFLKDEWNHRIAGQMECAEDDLSTPLSWRYATEIAPPFDGTLKSLTFECEMRAGNRDLSFTTGRQVRRTPRPESYSCLWAMFEAVQRLPRDRNRQYLFTFFDRLHSARPAHLLRYRESVSVNGQRLHGFEQLGEGILPSLFWTADNGRLALFSCGITGFVLSPTESAR